MVINFSKENTRKIEMLGQWYGASIDDKASLEGVIMLQVQRKLDEVRQYKPAEKAGQQ